MNGNKHYLLSYEHKEIENILNRVYQGMLLTKEEYDYLINKIGIKNISTFDGYYESLIGKPNIEFMIATAITDNNVKLMQYILKEVDTKDEQLIELLEVHIEEYEKLINDLQTGLIKLDKETKEYINNSVRELNKVFEEQVDNIEEILKHKADEDHIHLIDDIYDLHEILELKSNISHTHETDHIHTNKGLLDAVTELKIKQWDAKVSEDELPTKLSELMNDQNFITEKDLRAYLKDTLPDFDKFSLRDDCDYFLDGKADLFHLHEINEITHLEHILNSKVDKEKGKVLIDKALVTKIEEFLKRKEEVSDDNHVHYNMNAINALELSDFIYWNAKVDEKQMIAYVAKALEEYSPAELDRITYIGSISQEEYNELPQELKDDKSRIYIINDAKDDIDIEAFIRSSIEKMVKEPGFMVTQDILENKLAERLEDLKFKKIKQKDYIALSDEERSRTDIMYVITDTYDPDISEFVTKEVVEKMILDAAIKGVNIDLTLYDAHLQKMSDMLEYVRSLSGEYAKIEDLENYAKIEDLEQYAKTEDLEEYAKDEDLEEYAKTEDLEQYVKVEDIEELLKNVDFDNYVTLETFNTTIESLRQEIKDEIEIDIVGQDEYLNLTEIDPNTIYVISDTESSSLSINTLEKEVIIGRPMNPRIGQCFFDVNLGMPIWFNGSSWVDANGKEV